MDKLKSIPTMYTILRIAPSSNSNPIASSVPPISTWNNTGFHDTIPPQKLNQGTSQEGCPSEAVVTYDARELGVLSRNLKEPSMNQIKPKIILMAQVRLSEFPFRK